MKEVNVMKQALAATHVGAPDPDLKTSPILEEYDEDAPAMVQEYDELPICWYNGESYPSGATVSSGDGSLLRCEKGVWVRQDLPVPQAF
jgi:hypothetical protein